MTQEINFKNSMVGSKVSDLWQNKEWDEPTFKDITEAAKSGTLHEKLRPRSYFSQIEPPSAQEEKSGTEDEAATGIGGSGSRTPHSISSADIGPPPDPFPWFGPDPP